MGFFSRAKPKLEFAADDYVHIVLRNPPADAPDGTGFDFYTLAYDNVETIPIFTSEKTLEVCQKQMKESFPHALKMQFGFFVNLMMQNPVPILVDPFSKGQYGFRIQDLIPQ